MIYLLDVNVLLPLLDPRHPFNSVAHQWFDRVVIGPDDRWATCALTENGYLKVGMNSAYAGDTRTGFAALMEALTIICKLPNHRFLAMDQSILTIVPPGTHLTPKQITDIYLLGLAIAHGGKLATFGRRIPAHLLPGGIEALEIIPGTPDIA